MADGSDSGTGDIWIGEHCVAAGVAIHLPFVLAEEADALEVRGAIAGALYGWVSGWPMDRPVERGQRAELRTRDERSVPIEVVQAGDGILVFRIVEP